MNQDERIEQLKAELRRLNGGEDPPLFGIDTLPKDVAEQFLQRIVDVETGRATNDAHPLNKDGTICHVAIPRRDFES